MWGHTAPDRAHLNTVCCDYTTTLQLCTCDFNVPVKKLHEIVLQYTIEQ